MPSRCLTPALVAAPGQFLPKPARITPQIENGADLRLVFGLPIIDPEREAIRQQPIEPELPNMNTVVEREAIEIAHQRVRAVVAKAGLLRVLEIASRIDVLRCLRQDDDPPHRRRLVSRFLS